MFEFKGTFPQSFDPWDTSSYIWNQILENKCVDFLPNYIWVKFIKITAWKATEGQDLQISSKKSTKNTKIWTKWLVQFWREIWRNFSKSKKTWIFYRNLRISKYYKQNFKQFWAIWRSKIGICEKCLKILKKFVIFEFLREILCKSDLPKFCEFDKFLGCSTQICPSLRVFIFKQWNIAISCFGKNQHFWTHKWKFKILLWSEYWLDISKYALDWEDFYRVRETKI